MSLAVVLAGVLLATTTVMLAGVLLATTLMSLAGVLLATTTVVLAGPMLAATGLTGTKAKFLHRLLLPVCGGHLVVTDKGSFCGGSCGGSCGHTVNGDGRKLCGTTTVHTTGTVSHSSS
jgi:hypothetical protein